MYMYTYNMIISLFQLPPYLPNMYASLLHPSVCFSVFYMYIFMYIYIWSVYKNILDNPLSSASASYMYMGVEPSTKA